MAISVVQSAQSGNQASSAFTGSFAGNVTAGNTVYLAVLTFSSSNVTISSASPLLGGSAVTGAAKLAEVQSAFTATFTAYAAIWQLPNAAGGSATFGITVTNGTLNNAQTGLLAWEVAGLGATPALDASSTASGASTSATSGTTGATTAAAEIVIGALIGIDGLTNTPGQPAGYTNLTIGAPGSASCGGYQVQSASGNTYTYATANGGSHPWAGAIITASAGLIAGPSSLALAPMALAAGALTGGNVTATASLALAPMALAGLQARGGGTADRHHRWRR